MHSMDVFSNVDADAFVLKHFDRTAQVTVSGGGNCGNGPREVLKVDSSEDIAVSDHVRLVCSLLSS